MALAPSWGAGGWGMGDPLASFGFLDPLAYAGGGPTFTLAQQPMDIVERPDAYEIVTDVPGMTPDDITIDYQEQNQVLTIRGEHVERQIKEGGGFTRTERTRRSFTRSFTVPSYVLVDQICANVEHGVLSVVVPKRPSEQEAKAPRRIPVKPGAGRPQIGGTTGQPTTAQPRVGGAGDMEGGMEEVPMVQRVTIETMPASVAAAGGGTGTGGTNVGGTTFVTTFPGETGAAAGGAGDVGAGRMGAMETGMGGGGGGEQAEGAAGLSTERERYEPMETAQPGIETSEAPATETGPVNIPVHHTA